MPTRVKNLPQALARPYLAAMDAVPATLRIGIHIRMGDSALANTWKTGDKRYKPGCSSISCCFVLGKREGASCDQYVDQREMTTQQAFCTLGLLVTEEATQEAKSPILKKSWAEHPAFKA